MTNSPTVEVIANADGTYQIAFQGRVVANAVPERWLNEELCVKLGFCGKEFEEIKRQLDFTGSAVFPV